MDSKGIAWQCNGQQRKGVDKLSVARAMRRMVMKRDAEEKQRHSNVLHGSEKHSKGRAKNGEDLRRKAKA